MNASAHIDPFTLRVDEVFEFSGGLTVFVGALEAGSPKLLAPCDVQLIVEGQFQAVIRLDAERTSGPLSQGRRAVETRSAVAVASLRGRDCLLIHR